MYKGKTSLAGREGGGGEGGVSLTIFFAKPSRLDTILVQEGISISESKQEVTKLVSHVRIDKKGKKKSREYHSHKPQPFKNTKGRGN